MLIDTSILVRALQPHDPLYELTGRALEFLLDRGEELNIVPQNLVEFWTVATRPKAQNGLEITPSAAAAELTRLKNMFVLLPDTPAIYPVWESLVIQHQVQGKPAHDARIAAAMQVHGVTRHSHIRQSGIFPLSGHQGRASCRHRFFLRNVKPVCTIQFQANLVNPFAEADRVKRP